MKLTKRQETLWNTIRKNGPLTTTKATPTKIVQTLGAMWEKGYVNREWMGDSRIIWTTK